MKILIIGFGSIGKRHYEILKGLYGVEAIDIVSKQNIKENKTFYELSDVENFDIYDYFIISSETIKHFLQLEYLCQKVENKKILVEKPLYDKIYKNINTTNKIYVAYNLRFHPVLIKLKELLKNEEVFFANIMCGQYLPTWRPEQDYTKSYSADIKKGGGVLRDLSHELDYANWLFGDLNLESSINTKISDLSISSDDIFTGIFISKNKTIINLSIDYISKSPLRQLLIHTKNKTIKADMVNSKIELYGKKTNQNDVKINRIDSNYTYTKMHQAILNNEENIICSFEDGIKITNLIEQIEFKDIKNG